MVTIVTDNMSLPCWGNYGTEISFPMVLIKYLRQKHKKVSEWKMLEIVLQAVVFNTL